MILSKSDLVSIEFLFGDVSELTPMQRMDLLLWYKGKSNSVSEDSNQHIQTRIEERLRKEPGLTLSVIRNRFKNKYTMEKISEVITNMINERVVEERESPHGKSKYFLKVIR